MKKENAKMKNAIETNDNAIRMERFLNRTVTTRQAICEAIAFAMMAVIIVVCCL